MKVILTFPKLVAMLKPIAKAMEMTEYLPQWLKRIDNGAIIEIPGTWIVGEKTYRVSEYSKVAGGYMVEFTQEDVVAQIKQ